MKILYSWLNDFIDLSTIEINDVVNGLTNIGLEVESVDEYNIDFDILDNLVVGEVIECYKHPNADRLHCTKVKINENDVLDIVCGAPNVKEGLKVVVAQVGTTLKTFSGEIFKIKKATIRGKESFGMLCAEDEIGLSNNHDCIIEVPSNFNIGTKVSEIYKNRPKKDYLISVDLTPNRSYAASYLGIARDLSVLFNIKLKQKDKLYDFKTINSDFIKVEVPDTNLCNQYSYLLIKNVKVCPTFEIIKYRLTKIGCKSINNVVDISNYVMFEYGHPIHVYDYNKIKGSIYIGRDKKNKFNALNGIEYNLDNDIIVKDEDKVLSLAGVIGGQSSSVDFNTTDILIECACFNNVDIWKTSKRLSINTEASYRFSRFIDPTDTEIVLSEFINLLYSKQPQIDIKGYINKSFNSSQLSEIRTTFSYINKVIGQEIAKNTILDILNRLDIKTVENDDNLIATIPLYRFNIVGRNDLIDEILRIYGYNNLNDKSLFNISYPFNECSKYLEFNIRNDIYDILCSNGFYEIRTNSLVSSDMCVSENIVELSNSSSIYQNVLRDNLLFSTLNVIKYNLNRGNEYIKVFELGSVFNKFGDDFIERKHLFLGITGKDINYFKKNIENDFYNLKQYVFKIFYAYNLTNIELEDFENKYLSGVKIKFSGENIGYIAMVSDFLENKFEFKEPVYVSDIDFEKLINIIKNSILTEYIQVSKFNSIKRDLSLIVDNDVKYDIICKTIKSVDKRIESVLLLDVYINDNLKNKKTYTVSFIINSGDLNLDNNEITTIFENVIKKCESDINAEIKRN